MLYRIIVFILTSVSIFLFSHSSVFAHTSVVGATPKEGGGSYSTTGTDYS